MAFNRKRTVAVFLLGCSLWAQQPPAAPPGATQSDSGVTLDSLLQLARENNPTLKQADAEIRGAEARRRQAGAMPNPMVGYVGEDIRGGSHRGGQHGFFVEQPIILGGKLAAAQNVFTQHVAQSQLEAEEQRLRVEHGVRLLFYRALARQQSMQVRQDLSAVANEAVAVTRQLGNVGQADQTDVLQAEIEAQHAEMAAQTAKSGLQRAWRELAASVGVPELPLQKLAGTLQSEGPRLTNEPWMKKLLGDAPAVKIAQSEILRREAEAAQARKAYLPDLRVRAGLLQNRALLEGSLRPVGLQGFVELGVQLPIFNRNRGGITAAEAEVARSRHEEMRTRLVLQQRAAPLWQEYEESIMAAKRYRAEILPRAQQAQELMAKRYSEMAAAYPQVLVARRTYLQLQLDYIGTLDRLWSSTIELESFMLTDALEAPARAGEMDRAVREINLPSGRTTAPER